MKNIESLRGRDERVQRHLPVSACILAGGKSTRMGSCKALLDWNGKHFLAYLAGLFTGFSECLISVDLKERFTHLSGLGGAVFVEDARSGYGPLEGLYRLLQQAKEETIFVLATDMPLMSQEFVNTFARLDMEEAQAVICAACGKFHPLCGLYKKSCIPALETMFAQGEHSIKALLKQVPSRVIEVEELGFPPEILANVNTRQEYEELTMKWREQHACCGHNIQ